MKDRWGVELVGHTFDLDDAFDFWGDRGGAVRVAQVQDTRGDAVRALFASALDRLSTAAQVDAHAPALMDRVNGVLFVRDQRRGAITFSSVLERLTQDAADAPTYRRHAILHAAAGGVRIRTRGTLTAIATGGTAAPVPPPRERDWLDASLSDDVLSDVLTFLRGQPGWFDLWKAFEMMRLDVQQRAGVARWERSGIEWPSPKQMDRFESTANFHRHSRAKKIKQPIQGWMPLEDARALLARLFVAWMDWR